MKILTLLLTILLFSACTNEQDESEFLNKKDLPEYRIETFAVVWKTYSLQKDKMEKIVPTQTEQLKSLWEQGIVENVYFKTDEKFGKDDTWPNIMFFIKAKNQEAAKEILDEMDFVKHKFAMYELHPVGVLWLKRNEKAIERVQKTKRTFGVVWATDVEKQISDDDIKIQSEDFTNLWNDGFIENAYFDIIGSSTGKKDRPTVVNFVNAENEEEANNILGNLHFIKKGLSSYMLFDVGILWLGQYEVANSK